MGGLATERFFLGGKTLQEIEIGSGNGLTILSVVRHDEPQLHNRVDFVLEKDDMLLARG